MENKDDNVDRNRFRPITDWCSHTALFFDDLGHYVGKKSLKWKENTFSYEDRTFNFMPEQASFFKLRTWFKTTKYYHYNINNPMPLLLDKKLEPVINASSYKVILDSDLVKKLNPHKFNLLDMVGGWKGLIILIIIGGVIYYLAQGGSLSGAEQVVKK